MLRPRDAVFLSLVLSATVPAPAAAQPEPSPITTEQLERVGGLLKEATDPALDIDIEPLDLPSGLSRADARASLNQLWSVYTDNVFDQELGALPPTVQEILQQAENGQQAIPPDELEVPISALLRVVNPLPTFTPGTLTLGELEMPYIALRREQNAPPHAGRALFICTHGGGRDSEASGPHAWPVNTVEWQVQAGLAAEAYPAQGVYFVPRMADDRMGRWYHAHNHDAFERVVEHAIAHWGVDPNRVYLLGISEGGYGTAILAPFMPDRFGGANAMAAGIGRGNPPENLRNLAFRTDVGENDTMFDRVDLAKAFHQTLDELHAAAPDGYTHDINVQPGRGHGIDYLPGVAWIAEHRRNPWPSHITWTGKVLDGRRRDRMYWIEVDGEVNASAIRVVADANRDANTIDLTVEFLDIEGDDGNPTHAHAGAVNKATRPTGIALRALLHDDLIDLDKPLTVTCNGEVVFAGRAPRDAAVQLRTLAGYGDPTMAASAEVVIPLD